MNGRTICSSQWEIRYRYTRPVWKTESDVLRYSTLAPTAAVAVEKLALLLKRHGVELTWHACRHTGDGGHLKAAYESVTKEKP